VRVERLSGARETDALTYLGRSPFEHVFLTYLILFDTAPATRNAIRIALNENDEVTGVAYFGRQVAIAAEDPDTIGAFAEVARSHRGERMIVGPRETTMQYWSIVETGHPHPRAIRTRQLVMKLDRTQLKPYEHTVLARRARIDEWTSVADNSAKMIAQELEYDPLRSSPEFTANVRAMIDRGLWWVGESLGRICFYCNIGPWSPQTAQLQGIWTPPEMRGKGLATAALSAVCDRLLGMTPTLSLYVNDFNLPAIALYERVGFETVGEFATLLF